MMGPGLAYGLGGIMLRLYVDIDRMPPGEPHSCSWGPLTLIRDPEPGTKVPQTGLLSLSGPQSFLVLTVS